MNQRGNWLDILSKRWRSISLGVCVGLGALCLALWGVPLEEVWTTIRSAHLGWLSAMGGVFLMQQAIRAWRQQIILKAVAPNHRYRASLSALCIGFLFVNTLPVRLGEVVRPMILTERDNIPFGSGLAMVVVERLVDLLSMFLMIALVAWLVPVPSQEFTLAGQSIDWTTLGLRAAGLAAPLVLLVLLVVVFFAPRIEPLFAARPLLRRLHPLVASFSEGAAGLKSPRRAFAVTVLTVLTWSLSGLMFSFVARAFGIGDLIGYGEGIGLLAIVMAGMIVPSAPGFTGTFEAFLRAGLVLYGVSGGALDATSIAYALTFHWWQYGVQAASAVFFLLLDGFNVRTVLDRLATHIRAQNR